LPHPTRSRHPVVRHADARPKNRAPHRADSADLLDRRLLTVTEVGQVTGLSPNAIYRAIWSGELRASKLRGRLRVQFADIEAWIESNVVPVPVRVDRREPAVPARPPRRDGPSHGLRELLKVE
jgi:excisionase family DNA binding protein